MRSTGAPLRDDAISIDPQGLKGIACRACSRRSFPQRPLCPHCGADTIDNVVLSDRGRVASWTVVHQAPPPLQTPYTLATVDLDDGVRLLGAVVGEVQIDTQVAVELFPVKSDTSGKPLWWYRFRGGEEKR
jgi:uncharacterized protein